MENVFSDRVLFRTQRVKRCRPWAGSSVQPILVMILHLPYFIRTYSAGNIICDHLAMYRIQMLYEVWVQQHRYLSGRSHYGNFHNAPKPDSTGYISVHSKIMSCSHEIQKNHGRNVPVPFRALWGLLRECFTKNSYGSGKPVLISHKELGKEVSER